MSTNPGSTHWIAQKQLRSTSMQQFVRSRETTSDKDVGSTQHDCVNKMSPIGRSKDSVAQQDFSQMFSTLKNTDSKTSGKSAVRPPVAQNNSPVFPFSMNGIVSLIRPFGLSRLEKQLFAQFPVFLSTASCASLIASTASHTQLPVSKSLRPQLTFITPLGFPSCSLYRMYVYPKACVVLFEFVKILIYQGLERYVNKYGQEE
ncbi:hypothetical protein JCM19037_2949 [Geomicrobium sp. JCM 19037]|nr:hypothetical protein JCM19037_2949 [Geomicrobium sp. JCM 19037]